MVKHKQALKITLLSAMFFALLVGLCFWLQKDQALSNDAQRWMEQLSLLEGNESKAFYYLYGMVAKDDDPITIGRQRWQESIARLNDDENPALSQAIPDYPEDLKLPLPSNDSSEYCHFRDQNCMATIMAASDQWQDQLTTHKEILVRYKEYLTLTDYATIVRPTLDVTLPEYAYISRGNRLFIFEQLLMAEAGESAEAIIALMKNTTDLRRQLMVADNLIHKMVFLHQVANNLDVIAYLSQQYRRAGGFDSLEGFDVGPVPVLTAEEYSLERPMYFEFGFGGYAFLSLKENAEIFEIGGHMPAWLVRVLYKPNKTINEAIKYYQNITELSQLTPAQFAQHDFTLHKLEDDRFDWLNPVGSVLTANSLVPDMSPYLARLHDLSGKITLVNGVLAGQVGHWVNPYYPAKADAFTLLDGQVCLDGPLEDTRKLRCIALAQ